MQVAHRLDVARGGIDRVGCRRRIQLGADERRHIEPCRPIGNAANVTQNVSLTQTPGTLKGIVVNAANVAIANATVAAVPSRRK